MRLSYLLLAWLPNDDFENSIIPSTFISGTSYCMKKILFIQFMLSIYNSKDSAIQISFNGL